MNKKKIIKAGKKIGSAIKKEVLNSPEVKIGKKVAKNKVVKSAFKYGTPSGLGIAVSEAIWNQGKGGSGKD